MFSLLRFEPATHGFQFAAVTLAGFAPIHLHGPVGTLPAQGCGFPYDGENEGHGGFLATNVAAQNQLPGWLAAVHPRYKTPYLAFVWTGIVSTALLVGWLLLATSIATPAECGRISAPRSAALRGRISGPPERIRVALPAL